MFSEILEGIDRIRESPIAMVFVGVAAGVTALGTYLLLTKLASELATNSKIRIVFLVKVEVEKD